MENQKKLAIANITGMLLAAEIQQNRTSVNDLSNGRDKNMFLLADSVAAAIVDQAFGDL